MVPRQHRAVDSQPQTSEGTEASASVPLSFLQDLRSGRFWVRWGSKIAIIGVPTLLLLLLVVYPLAAIILQSVFPNLYTDNPNLIPGLNSLSDLTRNPTNYLAFFNSLWLAAITAVLACLLGTSLALLARRTDMPFRRSLDTLVWIVFFIPSFLVGEAWSLVAIRGGIPDQYLHFPDAFINWFFSPAGVIFILSLKTFPYVYLSVTAALHWLGSEFEDAAHVVGAKTWRAWWSINLPLLWPAILSAGLIAFAEALSDFGTAATIAQNASVTLITYQIYTAINTAPVDFSLAAALSLFLFVAIALALLLQSAILRTRSFQVISGKSRPVRMYTLGFWKWPALLYCCVIFILALVIPLAACVVLSLLHAFGQGLSASNWTLDNYQAVLMRGSDDLDSLGRSFWLSLGNGTITMLVGLPIAFIIRRTQLPGRRLLSLITLVTIAVPGLILACGYIFAWNAPYLSVIGIGGPDGVQFYGTVWILLAAYVGGSLPYATRLGIGALEQVSGSMLETAQVQGSGLFQTLARIVGPLLRNSLGSIWLLVFTNTMFELAASELLYPPGQPTMPVMIVSLFGTFRLGQGMALAMLNVGLVIVAVIVIRFVPWIIQRLLAYNAQKERRYVSTDQTIEEKLRITAGRL
jgi:iron(III) transport system permease protein